ncbi:hypothetical protein CLOSTHATH_01643 [Hungatella hathewayi DSM 13479]|uniref:Uncharacterized protein n=1 Tax=Hungatella hathewayi DSM 13479 TaxID=566550 RepID=D3ADG5_9FIRM|nr:hypothetical protein CLOSTHATH_01643 [Hungatella hathewayi DSM 13479]
MCEERFPEMGEFRKGKEWTCVKGFYLILRNRGIIIKTYESKI